MLHRAIDRPNTHPELVLIAVEPLVDHAEPSSRGRGAGGMPQEHDLGLLFVSVESVSNDDALLKLRAMFEELMLGEIHRALDARLGVGQHDGRPPGARRSAADHR